MFCYAVYPVEDEEDYKIPGENGEYLYFLNAACSQDGG
jgi:hypothetical protein